MTESNSSPKRPPTISRRLLLGAGSVVIVNVLMAAWYWYETKTLQRKSDEWESFVTQTDPQNVQLKQLQTLLVPRYADEYFTMWRLWSIVGQLNTREQFPVTEGPAIVSCLHHPGERYNSRWSPLNGGEPIRVVFYLPPGNHRLLHGFRSDYRNCKLTLPEKVVHDVAAGQVHEVKIFLEKEGEATHLRMTLDETTIEGCVLQGTLISLDQRGPGFCCQVPNMCIGPCDLVQTEPTWKFSSAMPNQLLRLEVSDRTNRFELRFGIESDAPDTGSAVILAARSRDFLRRISADGQKWKSPSDAAVALRSFIPDISFPNDVPQIDEVFETPDGSARLIFREGWAEKTKEPW